MPESGEFLQKIKGDGVLERHRRVIPAAGGGGRGEPLFALLECRRPDKYYSFDDIYAYFMKDLQSQRWLEGLLSFFL